VVSALNRKLLRDLRIQVGQLVSIALLVGCGIMAFVGMRSTRDSIRVARAEYYARNRFPHVFASLKRAPEALARQVSTIPGVAVVETRVVLPATLDVPGLPELATALLVSVPAERRAMLNDLHFVEGRYIAADDDDEAVASVKFAMANALRPGDTVETVVNGRWKRLRIVGIAMSPEYIYEMGAGGFMVDNRRFGILWMRRETLAAMGGMKGAFNDLAIMLGAGASEPEVRAAVDRLVAPYGGVGSIGRDRQVSAEVMDNEMQQLDALAYVFPVFFLGIAAFLLNVVLSRLIATQRGEIGTLKSFGYTDSQVASHYLGFALVALALGAVAGVLGAVWLGTAFTGTYAKFFGFPSLTHHTAWSTSLMGIAVCGGAALAGAMWAVRAAALLPPAEAMRAPAPLRFRASVLERAGLRRVLGPGARMVIRNLTRRPIRTGTSIIGIGLAGAVLVAGMYPFDAVDHVLDVQFRQAQHEDVTVAFTAPRGPGAARELAGLPGVLRVEPFRAVSVRIRSGHRARHASVLGLDSSTVLRALMDTKGGAYALPARGLVLSASITDALGVRAGDSVTIELLERGRETRRVPVVGRLDESIGLGYMERGALNRLLREGNVSSGAYLAVDPASQRQLYARLEQLPLVMGNSSRRAMLDYFERTIAESIFISASIVIFAAAVIAIGVIYNNSRIAISERGRELASLRVLGFTRGEVSRLFLGEQALVTVAGLPIGALAGFGFASILAAAFATERHRFPAVVEPATYAYSIGVVLLVAAAVALLVRRRIDHLDLIATLKTGE
jgi:putative ABC transport system permease protein